MTERHVARHLDRRNTALAFLVLVLFVGMGPGLRAETSQLSLINSLNQGLVPNEGEFEALRDELDAIPPTPSRAAAREWERIGRALGESIPSFLHRVERRDSDAVLADRFRNFAAFLERVRDEFIVRKQLPALHEIAFRARASLQPDTEPVSQLFIDALAQVRSTPRTNRDRETALDGLIATLKRAAEEIEVEATGADDSAVQAEPERPEAPIGDDGTDPEDSETDQGLDDPVPPTRETAGNLDAGGDAGTDGPEPPSPEQEPSILDRIAQVAMLVALAVVMLAIGLAIGWDRSARVGSSAGRYGTLHGRPGNHAGSPGSAAHRAPETALGLRSRLWQFWRRSEAPQASSPPDSTEPQPDPLEEMRKAVIARLHRTDQRVEALEAAHQKIEQQITRLRGSSSGPAMNSPQPRDPTAALERLLDDVSRLEDQVAELQQRPAPPPPPAQPAPPDPRPRLHALEMKAEQLSHSLQDAASRQLNLLEVESLALDELRPKILRKLQDLPFLQQLQQGDAAAKERATVLTTTLPKSLDGELAREAESITQPIREAWNIVSGLETLDRYLVELDLLQAESSDAATIAKNLFRLRDHSFRLHALLHTEQGDRWKDFRLEDWVRTRFRRFADELYREHWQRKLDGRLDDLASACDLADDVLEWGGLEVIRTEPGVPFDSRVHISLSTASNPNLGDGQIAGVVRVGFRDQASGQVIQQPEVVVNRR